MKYLRSFYKRHRGMAALALFLLLGQVVGTLLIPALIANVVDLGILPGNMDAILRTGGQMLAVALLSAAVAAAGSWVTADLGARFGFEMRSLLLRKSQELSLHQFDEVGVSSMITRTTSDITNLQQTMGMVLQMVVPAPLIVGASIVMTAMVTPVMAIIQVGFMAALAAVAAPAGLLIWLCANVQVWGDSILNWCTGFLDPFARLLGLDGVILMAFLLGFPANEIVIPIIIMAYLSTGSLLEFDSLDALRQLLVDHGWTWLTAVCTMLFSLMHWPCSTTCLTIGKETKSAKWTLLSIAIPTGIGMAVCFLVASAARLLGLA